VYILDNKGKLALAKLCPAIAAAKSAYAYDFIKSLADVHR